MADDLISSTSDDICLDVPQEAAGERLDKWLASVLAGPSRTQVKAMIEAGQVKLDGNAATSGRTMLAAGQLVQMRKLLSPPVCPEPQAIPLTILFEDDEVIVIDKHAGMVVHPAPGNWSDTLVSALLHHCGSRLAAVGDPRRPAIVHRLDKDTSGVMVAAKTQRAYNHLKACFADHTVIRSYLAFVVNCPIPLTGQIRTGIARHRPGRQKMAVSDIETARMALTEYRVHTTFGLADGRPVAALIGCRIHTGRTHQVRVHMANMSTPIIGDKLYGGRRGIRATDNKPDASGQVLAAVRKFRRQALHAHVLGFTHPVSGEDMRFDTSMPADMSTLGKALASLGHRDIGPGLQTSSLS